MRISLRNLDSIAGIADTAVFVPRVSKQSLLTRKRRLQDWESSSSSSQDLRHARRKGRKEEGKNGSITFAPASGCEMGMRFSGFSCSVFPSLSQARLNG